MIYRGISGRTYELDENKIAHGGEGVIYPIVDDGKIVAKIFKKDRRDGQREKKLRWMIRTKLTDEQLEQIAWPMDVIYDQSGFAGYVMPRLCNTEPLPMIYTEDRYTFRERVLVAYNLCAAVETAHRTGYICGDLNPQNICVHLGNNSEERYKVTLIDTDSYHIIKPGEFYRCEVGLPDYLAPEIQQKLKNGADLKTVALPTYTQETDYFALAVHIFMLLMNGCHPFACAKEMTPGKTNIARMTANNIRDSVVAPQPIENIRDGFFPFAQKKRGVVIPIYAPQFVALPPQMQNLFHKTFVAGYQNPGIRAKPEEWMEAIDQAIHRITIVKCPEGHEHFAHRINCPICEIFERITLPPPPPPPPPPLSPPPVRPRKDGSKAIKWSVFLLVISLIGLWIGAGLASGDISMEFIETIISYFK